jgi:peptidoglycan/LPS O-acetylase OafA/YrhL
MLYRKEIDGLRALAVMPVIFFHAGFTVFSGGYIGVDIFFVISGYLITSIILVELKSETFSIVNFYERRARRVLPALFLVVAVSLPFAWLWLSPLQLKNFSASLVAVSTFSSNILFWITSGYFDSAAELKPLLHTWSLAVEEQYYLFFPIFLVLTWRFGTRRVIALLVVFFIASLAVAQILVASKADFAFFLLPTRGWELLIGAFIAYYLEEKKSVVLINQFIKLVPQLECFLSYTQYLCLIVKLLFQAYILSSQQLVLAFLSYVLQRVRM